MNGFLLAGFLNSLQGGGSNVRIGVAGVYVPSSLVKERPLLLDAIKIRILLGTVKAFFSKKTGQYPGIPWSSP
jgi:hypothetical protein